MNTSTELDKIAPALVKAQSEFPSPKKTKTNAHYRNKYADLGDIREAVNPALAKNGLTVVQPTRFEDGATVLVTRLIHESGQWIEGEYPVLPVQDTPQGLGSAMTYARRYALSALLGIVSDDDDDGNAASAKPEARKPAAPANPSVAAQAPIEDPREIEAKDYLKTIGYKKQQFEDFRARLGANWIAVALGAKKELVGDSDDMTSYLVALETQEKAS